MFCSHSRRELQQGLIHLGNTLGTLGCVYHRVYPLNKAPDALVLLSMSYFLDGYITRSHLCRILTMPHSLVSLLGMPRCFLAASRIQFKTQGRLYCIGQNEFNNDIITQNEDVQFSYKINKRGNKCHFNMSFLLSRLA